jgi:uncharacterized membrane protein YqhA
MPERFGEMLEKALAGTLFASRWLLAPFYLGIVLGVVIHGVSMISSVLLALSGRISEGAAPPSASKSVAAEAPNGTQ